MADAQQPNGILQRLALIRGDERAPVLWACAYFFFLLAGYFVLRPIREQSGIREGLDNLPWLFTGTFAAMAVANPLYNALVSRFTRRQFIPIVYRFFGLNLVVFLLLFRALEPGAKSPLNWVFFVWLSVFNLFVVTVFRAFMADVFTQEQGKRLFAFIGIGGTLGAIVGAAVNAALVHRMPTSGFFVLSIVLLELAVQCMLRLSRQVAPRTASGARSSEDVRVEGSLAAALRLAFGSRFMLAIAGLMLLASIGFTMMYAEQARIVKASFADDASQQRAFAIIDFSTQSLTLLLQLFVTGRVLQVFGVTAALVALPLVVTAAFASLSIWPLFLVFALFQIAVRGTNYGLATPAREVLYTTLSRAAKYRAKGLIDTFVWRGGDLLGIWIRPLVNGLGVGLAYVAIPIGLTWVALAAWLGRAHERRVREAAAAKPAAGESSAA